MGHSEELPVHLFTTLPDIEIAQDILCQYIAMSSDNSCSVNEEPSYGLQKVDKFQLNDSVRDLCLSNEKVNFLLKTTRKEHFGFVTLYRIRGVRFFSFLMNMIWFLKRYC